MRSAIRLIFFLAVLLLISPFLISSLLIDQRGVVIPGHLVSKDEYITVRYGSWTRNLDITVRYDPPDGYGVAFLRAQVSPEQFDTLTAGDLTDLHYLRQDDLPRFPGATTLRQMHLLPTVRLAGQHAFSGFSELVEAHRTVFTTVLLAVLVLVLWRLLRIPFFVWVVATCVVSAVAMSVSAEFPRPMPAPANDLRTTTGTVKSLDRVEWLFQGSHKKGVHADQPIQIAGVQFVPEGRTEPVVAVDLIDEGSAQGLKEHGSVSIEYENASPRVAYIRGATRHFVRRNLQGVAVQGIATLVALAVLVSAPYFLSKVFRKLVGRPAR